MSAQPVEDHRNIPVLPCAPWCEAGEAKHADEHPDDRHCWSKSAVVVLSRGVPVQMNRGAWWHDWLTVCALLEPGPPEPIVDLHVQDADTEIKLTAAEARQLAAELNRHADLAEQGRPT